MLLVASWCLSVGVLLSLVLRRIHVVMLFGICLFAAVMWGHGSIPTTQYCICVLCALLEIHQATQRRHETTATAMNSHPGKQTKQE